MATHSVKDVIARIQSLPSAAGRCLDELPTPSFLVDIAKLKSNAQKMKERASANKVQMRPHIKTHKTIECALYQIYGDDVATLTEDSFKKTAKITVSTLGEARFFADHEFPDILYAVPIVKAKLPEAARLTNQITAFHVLIDSFQAVGDVLEYSTSHKQKFNVYVDIDCGYHRTGFDPASEKTLQAMEKLFKSDLVSVSGLYTHGGDSYHAHNSGEVVTYAQRESISVIDFAAKLKSLGFEVPVVSVGSTPTCSNPPTEWNQITEIHPGNYALYDVTQASIGSCSFDDNAGFVFARVISSYDNPKRLLIDAGALALSKDQGATHISADAGWGRIVGYEHLRITRISQELGVVESVSESFDVSSIPIGHTFQIMPNHSCLAAACFPKLFAIADGKVVDEWQTAPRECSYKSYKLGSKGMQQKLCQRDHIHKHPWPSNASLPKSEPRSSGNTLPAPIVGVPSLTGVLSSRYARDILEGPPDPGVLDLRKTPEIISLPMTTAMCIYSGLFMRFALQVKPRNMLLFACHACNETVQLTQLGRKLKYEYLDKVENGDGVIPPADK